ncbi:MAG: UDP-N-acetylmuramate--L-alanine ligase [Flavisolibacter sp.]
MNKDLKIPSLELSTLNGIKNVYFIGVGGIGMSALAKYCISKEMEVSGYDKTKTMLTEELESLGIRIHYQEDLQALSKNIDLVIYTPAVPKEHIELLFFKENGYKIAKRSELLSLITKDSFNICVAGTHGKTTISTMIGHILRHCGIGCTAFLGGISKNYNTNFWGASNNLCVIEADEYDRSFLKLNPDIAVITAIDADHLEIYGDEHSMQNAFINFSNQVKPFGILIHKLGLRRINEAKVPSTLTYSLQNSQADVYATDISIEEGGYRFSLQFKKKHFQDFKLSLGGIHNVENIIAAIAVSLQLKIDPEKIQSAVASFEGVKRRFEYVLRPQKSDGSDWIKPVLIDDYAHHPEELKALLTSVRTLYPESWVTIIFQPHLFSRTRDLADGFAQALSLADQVMLLPIYPARELPIAGISSQVILDKMALEKKEMITKDQLLSVLKKQAHENPKKSAQVFVMAGAGDIDLLVLSVKNAIS